MRKEISLLVTTGIFLIGGPCFSVLILVHCIIRSILKPSVVTSSLPTLNLPLILVFDARSESHD